MSKALRKRLESKVAEAVVKTVKQPDLNATMSDAKPIADAVIREALPVIINKTNSEPWYQSHVTLAALLTIALRLLAHYGYAVPADLHGPILDVIVKFGPEAAGIWVLLGRWFFSKPIGEGPILSRLFFWRKKSG